MKKNEFDRPSANEALSPQAPKAKSPQKLLLSLLIVVPILLGAGFFLLWNTVLLPNARYDAALSLMEQQKYEEAIDALEAMNGYRDSAVQIKECHYRKAALLLEEKRHDEAYDLYAALGDYKDSAAQLPECRYQQAIFALERAEHQEAYELFSQLKDYKNTAELLARFETKPTMETKPGGIEYQYFYDSKGQLAKTVSSHHITQYSYDEKGRVTEKRSERISDGSLECYRYVYDEKDRVIRESHTDLENKTTVTEHSFDSLDRLVQTLITDPDGKQSVAYECSYTEEGKLLRESGIHTESSRFAFYQSDFTYTDESYTIRTFLLDKDRNRIEERLVRLTHDDKELSYEAEGLHKEYTYDEKGNQLLSVARYSDADGNPIVSRTESRYNEAGDLVWQKKTQNGVTLSVSEYEKTYDAEGALLSKRTVTEENGKTTVTETVYGENGSYRTTIDTNGQKEVWEYVYNEQGLQTKQAITYADGRSSHSLYTYDEQGRLLTVEKKPLTGSSTFTVYTYVDSPIYTGDFPPA